MMHCFECGAAMPDNMVYCLLCGSKLGGEAETVVKERTPPKIVIMPPIPSRTEIAITWLSENKVIGVATLTAFVLLVAVFIIRMIYGK